jgi:2-dehydropantoate 2-reductase
MQILVLGAGGVGGYFGGRLVESGADVTFLVRPKRAEILRSKWLKINSSLGDFHAKVKTVTAEELSKTYDLVILTCKAYDLKSALKDIKKAIGKQTIILPLMNGLSQFDIFDKLFIPEHVLGGYCFVNAMINNQGEIDHLTHQQKIVFGARYSESKELANKVEKVFEKTSIEYENSDDIMLAMWEKLMFLSTSASITCLLRASLGDINKALYGNETILRMFQESKTIVEAKGYTPRPETMERFLKLLSDPDLPLKASMLIDMEKNKKTEADHIIGQMIQHGKELKLDIPLMKMAYCNLKVYENSINNTGAKV